MEHGFPRYLVRGDLGMGEPSLIVGLRRREMPVPEQLLDLHQD
jgi:hypothetical protein